MVTKRYLPTLLCTLALTSYSLAQENNTSDIPYDSLRVVLEEVYDEDQGVREEIMQSIQEGESMDPSLVARMNHTDSINQIRVNHLLERYGWLPQSQIGEKAASALFLVIQHADVETMRSYLPDLKEMVELDEADATSAALMEDRILMYDGKKQIYGTQASGRQKEDGTTEYFVWPIENPEKVNQLRAEVGFGMTVEENAKRLNATYNPNEKLPQ